MIASLALLAITTLPVELNNPYGLAIGPDGALYVCEIGAHRVSRIDLKTNERTTAADSLNEPYEVAFDRSGNMFIVDMKGNSVHRIDRGTATMSTVKTGDLRQPHSIAFDRDGRLLICDIGNNRIQRVDVQSGAVETIFTGTPKGTPTSGPRAIAVAPDGDLYIAFREGNSVYRMRGTDLELIADKLSGPKGVALAGSELYVADTESHSILRIDLRTRKVSVVADKLARPHGVFAAPDGAIYIGDSENHRVKVVR